MFTPWEWLSIVLIAALALRLLGPTYYRRFLSDADVWEMQEATYREVASAVSQTAASLARVEEQRDRALRGAPLVIAAAIGFACFTYAVPGVDEYPPVRVTAVEPWDDGSGDWIVRYASDDGEYVGEYDVWASELPEPGPPAQVGDVVDAWVQPLPWGSGIVLLLDIPHDPEFRNPATLADYLLSAAVFGGLGALFAALALIPTWRRGRLTAAATALERPLVLGQVRVVLHGKRRGAIPVITSPRAQPVDDAVKRLIRGQHFRLTGNYLDIDTPMWLVAGVEEDTAYLALFNGLLHPLRHPVPQEDLAAYCDSVAHPGFSGADAAPPQRRLLSFAPAALLVLAVLVQFIPLDNRELLENIGFWSTTAALIMPQWGIFAQWPPLIAAAEMREKPYWLEDPAGREDSVEVGAAVDIATDCAVTLGPAVFASAARAAEAQYAATPNVGSSVYEVSAFIAARMCEELARQGAAHELPADFEPRLTDLLHLAMLDQEELLQALDPSEGDELAASLRHYLVPGDVTLRSITGPVRSFSCPSEMYSKVPVSEWRGFWIIDQNGVVYEPYLTDGSVDARRLMRAGRDADEVERVRRF